jgi:hypothetical protein
MRHVSLTGLATDRLAALPGVPFGVSYDKDAHARETEPCDTVRAGDGAGGRYTLRLKDNLPAVVKGDPEAPG